MAAARLLAAAAGQSMLQWVRLWIPERGQRWIMGFEAAAAVSGGGRPGGRLTTVRQRTLVCISELVPEVAAEGKTGGELRGAGVCGLHMIDLRRWPHAADFQTGY